MAAALIVKPWLGLLILGTVGCYLPLLLNLEVQDKKAADAFLVAFHASQYKDGLLITVAVSIPMIFDFMFDLFNYRSSFRQDYWSRCFLFASILIPNIFMLAFDSPNLTIPEIVGFLRLKEVSIAVYFAAYLYNFGGPIWTVNDTYELAILLIGGESAQNLGPFLAGTYSLTFKALSYTLYGYAFVKVLKLSHFWFRYLGNRMLKLKQDEYRCTVFIIVGICAFIGSRTIDFIFAASTILECSMWCLVTHSFFTLIVAVIINIFNGRIARREMIIYNQVLQMQALRDHLDNNNNSESDSTAMADETVHETAIVME
eukprot:gene4361-8678_t